ncbi:CYTH and CHAD domain-containing protein [Actinacidiphila sp. ITFR-21]|uniref:CYTH and CHAD domain-containing protein n=1 Tax=Actinacidiphila sp. ITFR-21 TaxID=3075199 RepID=UPI002889E33D|nr:CYTH and CHAD domain-containing protein [Streptomyces sp. ITFR-21]WNI14433.1 CYTH and CHAD domain-containing protein [Streptomyces sp. ITFR-21]
MTTTDIEQETRFEGSGVFDPERLRGLPGVSRVREEQLEELDALYYDTAGLRLLAHGITLRRRTGGHDAGWHVKLPAAAATAAGDRGNRREIHAPLKAGKAGNVPGELNRHLKAYTRGEELVPVVHLRTHRGRYLLLDRRERCLAEVAHDRVAAQVLGTERLHPAGNGRGAAPAGGRSRRAGTDRDAAAKTLTVVRPGPGAEPAAGAEPARGAGWAGGHLAGSGTSTQVTHWTEIEIEKDQGGAKLMRAAAELLQDSGWHASPSAHKLGHALAGGLPEEFGDPEPGRRPKAGSAGEAVMARLGDQLGVLLRGDAAVRADESDAVHRMRSTGRRLRSVLRGSRRVLDRRRTDPVAAELRWLTGVLGSSRDHEVLAAQLRKQAGALTDPADKALARRIGAQETERHRAAQRAAVRALDSPRYHALLDALENLQAEPPLLGKAAGPAAEHLGKVAARDRRRLAGRITAAMEAGRGPAGDRALYKARKAARRSRHTAEAALPYGGRKAARLRDRTKALQQVLGDHQDAVMARAALPDLAAAAHAAGLDTFGYGRLHGLQNALARAARDRLPAAWDKAADPALARF